jgi:DUF1009 family protein
MLNFAAVSFHETGEMTNPVMDEQREAVKTRKRLGLLAGGGKLPGVLAQSAKNKGYDVVAFTMAEEAPARVGPHCVKIIEIAPGQLGRNMQLIKDEKLEELVFIGKMHKAELLKSILKLDWTAVRELSKLTDFSDDAIQTLVGDLAERHGVKVLTQTEFLKHIFPDVGVLTKRQPTADEYVDIEYGINIARELARIHVGQTVVVKDRMILAVEAIEGTDQAIKRGVQLAGGPVVVCKVPKKQKDPRFDTPTVGLNTLEAMIAPKPGGVLAIAANEVLVVEEKEMANYADRHNISIVAV